MFLSLSLSYATLGQQKDHMSGRHSSSRERREKTESIHCLRTFTFAADLVDGERIDAGRGRASVFVIKDSVTAIRARIQGADMDA